MRISDWSSDVCSSDLERRGVEHHPVEVAAGDADRERHRLADSEVVPQPEGGAVAGPAPHLAAVAGPLQLASASCWESECPYMYTSMVAGPLNNTYHSITTIATSREYLCWNKHA